MFNPYDPRQIRELYDAMTASNRRMSSFKEKYVDYIKEFAGDLYGENTLEYKTIVNMIAMAVDIHLTQLVPQTPQVSITSKFREYQSVASDFTIALNDTLDSLDAGDKFREVGLSAFFGMGVMKIALKEGNPFVFAGEEIDIGHLSMEPVAFDNFVYDTTAHTIDQLDFLGDRYRVRYDKFMQSDFYINKDIITHPGTESVVDEHGNDRAYAISHAEFADYDSSYQRHIELWDLFLPKEQLLITIPAEDYGGSHRPVRVIEWQGPRKGPYKMLRMRCIPENIMPAAPVNDLKHMHVSINNLVRKSLDQAERQKTVVGYRAGQEDEARRVQNASDGEFVGMMDPQSVNEVNYNGIDQVVQAFTIWLDQQFDRQAGNLSLLGGLGPSADTLGQERLLSGQNNAIMDIRKAMFRDFVKECVGDVAWYRWHDQFYSPQIKKAVRGFEESVFVTAQFAPEDRLGDFISYNLDIEAYSLEYQPPKARAQLLLNILQGVAMPALPFMQQQGIALDWERIFKQLAQDMSIPQLVEMLAFTQGERVPNNQPMSEEAVMKPPVTHRTNERINRAGSTVDGNRQMMIQALTAAGAGSSNNFNNN